MKVLKKLVVILLVAFTLVSCGKKAVDDPGKTNTHTETQTSTVTSETKTTPVDFQLPSDRGVWYEIFVRAFADSDGDGIGDFNGLTAKLDYLVDLGISGLWLMPINESPSYHQYDVTDYYAIDPDYGTMEDFENFLAECKARDIEVIIDLVVNHSSSQHPWFIEASKDKNSEYRDYYRWVDEDAKALM